MVVIGVCGISASAIFVRYSTADSSVTAASRLIWTVLLLLPAVILSKEIRCEMIQIIKKEHRIMLSCVLSGVFFALHLWLWFESLKYASVASSTTIVCTEVIWVAIGYCVLFKERLSGQEIAAIIITLLGSFIIAAGDFGGGSAPLYGDVLALLAAIVEAFYTLIGRRVRSTISTTSYTFLLYSASALTLILISLIQGISLTKEALTTNMILIGFLLAFFSTILGHSIFSWCLKFLSPAFVSASKLCEPVIAAILAAILFLEIPSIWQVVGGVIILGGVLYYSKLEQEKNS